jgi:hypothetical protein
LAAIDEQGAERAVFTFAKQFVGDDGHDLPRIPLTEVNVIGI